MYNKIYCNTQNSENIQASLLSCIFIHATKPNTRKMISKARRVRERQQQQPEFTTKWKTFSPLVFLPFEIFLLIKIPFSFRRSLVSVCVCNVCIASNTVKSPFGKSIIFQTVVWVKWESILDGGKFQRTLYHIAFNACAVFIFHSFCSHQFCEGNCTALRFVITAIPCLFSDTIQLLLHAVCQSFTASHKENKSHEPFKIDTNAKGRIIVVGKKNSKRNCHLYVVWCSCFCIYLTMA